MFDFKSMTTCQSSCLTPGRLGRVIGGFLLSTLLLASFVSTSRTASAFQQHQATIEPGLLGGAPAAGLAPTPGDWGDDTIGALPVIGDDGALSFAGLPTLANIMFSSGPSVFLEGTVADLKRMIVDADGDVNSFAYVDVIAGGKVRVMLQGASRIELNRALFASGRVKVGMFTGLDFDQSRVSFEIGGKQMSNVLMNPAVMTGLRLQSAIDSGLLDSGPISANVQSLSSRAAGDLSFSVHHGLVVLEQFQ